jgi:hypothetical protein
MIEPLLGRDIIDGSPILFLRPALSEAARMAMWGAMAAMWRRGEHVMIKLHPPVLIMHLIMVQDAVP